MADSRNRTPPSAPPMDDQESAPAFHVSEHFRYYSNYGQGGFKYDPVNVSKAKPSQMEKVAQKRRDAIGAIKTKTVLSPHANAPKKRKKQQRRKSLVVPVARPTRDLLNKKFRGGLIWSKTARERNTALVMPQSDYDGMGDTDRDAFLAGLEQDGVGLSTFTTSGDRAPGFGASRRAAQLVGQGYTRRKRVLMADINVRDSQALRDEALSEDDAASDDEFSESDSERRAYHKLPYRSLGHGRAKTLDSITSKRTAKNLAKTTRNAKKWGGGRPMEQFVSVHSDQPYPTEMIHSSEDALMTRQSFTALDSHGGEETTLKAHRHWQNLPNIDKVSLSGDSLLSASHRDYITARDSNNDSTEQAERRLKVTFQQMPAIKGGKSPSKKTLSVERLGQKIRRRATDYLHESSPSSRKTYEGRQIQKRPKGLTTDKLISPKKIGQLAMDKGIFEGLTDARGYKRTLDVSKDLSRKRARSGSSSSSKPVKKRPRH